MIRFIAVIDKNRGLPPEPPRTLKISTDVKNFREKTKGHDILMGYGTYKEFTAPLPERRNLVATRSGQTLRPGFERVSDARAFLQKFGGNRASHLDAVQGSNENRASRTQTYGKRDSQAADTAMRQEPASVPGSTGQQGKAVRGSDVWVIGGAGLFAETIDLADELYITQLEEDLNCAKSFPEYKGQFELVSQSPPVNENGFTFRFEIWRRNT